MNSPGPLPAHVTIVEVGPRDGLQNEAVEISTTDKVEFVDRLSETGLTAIEVSAFVSPKWIPQLSDAAEVFARITKRPGVRYSALVPNVRGFERAMRAGVRDVAIAAAASETFSRKNINQSIDESLAGYAIVCQEAAHAGVHVRAYLSTSFGCPYEGAVDPARVSILTARLLEMGAFEVSVSDTIGVAHPGQVPAVIGAVLERTPIEKVALHFHDTRGTALANVLVGLQLGVSTFDASSGGLGGCPYAPGASGNLATDDLLYMLDGLGIRTGVSLERISRASWFIGERIGRPLTSRYAQSSRPQPNR